MNSALQRQNALTTQTKKWKKAFKVFIPASKTCYG